MTEPQAAQLVAALNQIAETLKGMQKNQLQLIVIMQGIREILGQPKR